MSGSPFRYRNSSILLALLILVSWPAPAQEPVEPPKSAAAAPVVGDVLTLKNGTRIVGQIVRSGPRSYEVQIIENVKTLPVDRSLVFSIEYDNIDPLRSRREDEALARDENAGETIKAEELSPRFARRLYTPYLEEEKKYTGRDLITVLEDASRLSGAPITVHQSVRDMDRSSRQWTFVAAPSTTALDLLQRLMARFENLQVEFEYKRVVVRVKEARDPNAGRESRF